jgi:hypothetical protein
VDELGFGDHGRPADTAAFSDGHRSGVGGTLQDVGAFHLGEQRQQHHSELCHRIIRVAGIDADRIGKVTHADAAFAQVVNQVETSRTVRPSRSRVWTTIMSPSRA